MFSAFLRLSIERLKAHHEVLISEAVNNFRLHQCGGVFTTDIKMHRVASGIRNFVGSRIIFFEFCKCDPALFTS